MGLMKYAAVMLVVSLSAAQWFHFLKVVMSLGADAAGRVSLSAIWRQRCNGYVGKREKCAVVQKTGTFVLL